MKLDPFRLLDLAVPHPQNTVAGVYRRIFVRPDFASDETVCIGVIASAGGMSRYRLLSSFDQFTRIFGHDSQDELDFLLRAVRGAIKTDTLDRLHAVELGQVLHARAMNFPELLQQAYTHSVRMDRPPQPSSSTVPQHITNVMIRRSVFNLVKQSVGMDAERYIADDEDLIYRDGDRAIALDIPIRTQKSIASLVSAGYMSSEAVERTLFKCFADLCAAQRLNSPRAATLFVYCPQIKGRTPATHRRICNVVDLATWKLKQVGITLRASDSVSQLAQNVVALA